MLYKGVMYYPSFNHAREKRANLQRKFPECRVVDFVRGYAIQYRISGGYYPMEPSDFDRTGHWDVEEILQSAKEE